MRPARFFRAVAHRLATPLALAQAPAPTPRAQPSPEETKKIMDAGMGAIAPRFAGMTEVMIDAQIKYAAMPETAEAMATFKKNLYDSLVKRGFKPESALQIVIATRPPSAAPGMQ